MQKSKIKILVIGDSCTDEFVYCNIDRLCPEAPVPILTPIKKIKNSGMAGNVVSNLKALGAQVDLLTNDEMIEKIRYIDNKSGQMVMRLDIDDECDPYDGETYIAVDYDAIVISDYNKGFLSKKDIAQWVDSAKCPTFLDTKKHLGNFAWDVDFVKINQPEWELNKFYPKDNIIITDGKNGAKYKGKTYPVKNQVKVSNVSGAGDTFLAGFVYKYISLTIDGSESDTDVSESIEFANKCASKVVQERGVTTV
tara:strand:+ start:4799 stop:5554 length:756 start_codon:yes stop_codon:yes gene_type:complete